MNPYATRARNKAASALTAGAFAIGALAATGLGAAPSANATCISVFGIGGGANCSSSLTSIAIAIGKNTLAEAEGILTAAVVIGSDGSYAVTSKQSLLSAAVGLGAVGTGTTGIASFAGVLGINSFASAGSKFGNFGNFSIAVGRDLSSDTQGSVNLAVDFLARGGQSKANGFGNVAVLTGAPGGSATAIGALNNATNLFSRNSDVSAKKPGALPKPANLSWAFSVLGSDNYVAAGPGPLALAGSIFQTGATVTKEKPGLNINGFRIGGAASRPVSPAATVRTHRASARVHPAAAGNTGKRTSG